MPEGQKQGFKAVLEILIWAIIGPRVGHIWAMEFLK